MIYTLSYILCSFLFIISSVHTKPDTPITEENCEVCVKLVRRFTDTLEGDEKNDASLIEIRFKQFCKNLKGKDERFCYYVGGLETSATYIVNEMTKPISWGMPAEKVCEKLRRKDSQICDLKYEKEIDLGSVSLTKLKVSDLKKILSNWGEECRGCSEKMEFVKMVQQLLPKYNPAAAAKQSKLSGDL
jgi:hypothetical protein